MQVAVFQLRLITAGLLAVLSGPLHAQLTDVTQPGDPIVPTSNNSPASEGVANAIDNQPTKYLNFDKLNTGFTVTPMQSTSVVTGITLTSANDHPERDPASYTLEGSNDGTNFTAISSGGVPPFPARFHTQYIYFSEHTNWFKTYRLIFPTVVNPATANSMQISEVELLGHVNTNPVPCSSLIARQPADTPVLLGARATFHVRLTGPGVCNGIATASKYREPPALLTSRLPSRLRMTVHVTASGSAIPPASRTAMKSCSAFSLPPPHRASV